MFLWMYAVLIAYGIFCYYLGYQRGKDRCSEDSYIRGYNEGKGVYR